MKNYFEEYYHRYEELKRKLEDSLEIPEGDLFKDEHLRIAISHHHQSLNNIVWAGLGMGTLYLRMGAVLMIAEKTREGAESDVSFLKVIADKLIHNRPTDVMWKDI